MQKTIVHLFFFLICISSVFSQENIMPVQNETDTATFMIWASPNFSVQIPFGKGYLSSTFKYNFSIGVDVTMKTQTNWTLDVAFNYMFGSKIRLSPKDIIGDMWISDNDKLGAVYNAAGENSKALSYEGRYWYFGATLGKMISIDRWKNSGLWLKLGAGYFGHKIYFADSYNLFPQIDQKTYRLGYDQRAHGIAFNQFFGYMFMQKRRVLSFYFGVELWEIFTKPDRGYIFVGQYVGPTDPLPKKFSGLLGVKLGWILPFYEKNRVVTYYYF